MARGRDAHEARQAELNALGKDLSRRAGSVCELCGGRETPRPFLVSPPDEPDLDHAILACERCRELLGGPKLPRDASGLRFLETAIWSEVPPAQVAAVRLLRRLAAAGVTWAAEADHSLYLSEEVEERL